MLKELYENAQTLEKEYQAKKHLMDSILKDCSVQCRKAQSALMDAFVEEKCYIPIERLSDYEGKHIDSIKVLRGRNRLAYITDAYVDKGILDSVMGGINNDGFIGFYDVEIDGKILEDTSYENLIRRAMG